MDLSLSLLNKLLNVTLSQLYHKTTLIVDDIPAVSFYLYDNNEHEQLIKMMQVTFS